MIGQEPHHIRIDAAAVAGNGGRGRVFLVPGSLARAEAIAERFEDRRVFPSPRRLDVHTGRYTRGGRSVDVGACPTGMGCPSVGIVVAELCALGVRRLVRVGSAGSLQPGVIGSGDLVIATGAVRDEASSDAFASRDVPALAHPDWVLALRRAALDRGVGSRTFEGLVHTKDSLYGREFATGPRAVQNRAYMDELRALSVLATEMESSHLFMLAQAAVRRPTPLLADPDPAEIKAGTVLAVIGDEGSFAAAAEARAAEELAIDVALDAALALLEIERQRCGEMD